MAFVFGLFAPALSQAFVPQAPAHATQVCTAAGMVMMPIGDSPGQHSGPLGSMTHCDMCCSHQAAAMLPSPPDLPPLVCKGRVDYPPLFYQSPAPQFAWTPAQSRAPPGSFF